MQGCPDGWWKIIGLCLSSMEMLSDLEAKGDKNKESEKHKDSKE